MIVILKKTLPKECETCERLIMGRCVIGSGEDLPDNCPLTDLVRTRGKWMHHKDPMWSGGGKTVCTSCRFGFAEGAYHEVDEFRYCPMCGARMVSE